MHKTLGLHDPQLDCQASDPLMVMQYTFQFYLCYPWPELTSLYSIFIAFLVGWMVLPLCLA